MNRQKDGQTEKLKVKVKTLEVKHVPKTSNVNTFNIDTFGINHYTKKDL